MPLCCMRSPGREGRQSSACLWTASLPSWPLLELDSGERPFLTLEQHGLGLCSTPGGDSDCIGLHGVPPPSTGLRWRLTRVTTCAHSRPRPSKGTLPSVLLLGRWPEEALVMPE